MNRFAIESSELTKQFGTVTAVDRITLQVPEHSVYGFLGPNGAGKTTTIRMILGLLHPSAGEVRLFGSPFTKTSLGRIGSLVEVPSVYLHLTGRENLEVTRRLLDIRAEAVTECLKLVRLESDASRLVKEYSLGMKQRLGLAQALLTRPELLVLDEPTNGLDPSGISEIRELLRRLPQERGTTIFLSSHLLSEVEQIATHIGVIDKGKILFQGELGKLQKERNQRLIVQAENPDNALKILTQHGWTASRDGNGTLTVEISTKLDTAEVARLLTHNGISLYHLSLSQSTLEELFFQLTGN